MSAVKKICIAAVCIALCAVLPPAFHAFSLGMALSPLHFPVLLCGLVCGWPYGLACGIVGPLLSSLISSMPPASQLVHMVPELCAYGLFTGLFTQFIRTGRTPADLYCSLVPAMLLGRVVGGLTQAAVYLSGAERYTLALWTGSYLVGTLPAIILQLILIPVLVLALTKARLIPERYPVVRPAV